MERLPYHWPPPMPHVNCRCVLLGEDGKVLGQSAEKRRSLEGEDAMCMDCVRTAWRDLMARDTLALGGVRESLLGAQLDVLPASGGKARIRVLLPPEDAVRVMIHAHILDDLDLALSCELGLPVRVVISFH